MNADGFELLAIAAPCATAFWIAQDAFRSVPVPTGWQQRQNLAAVTGFVVLAAGVLRYTRSLNPKAKSDVRFEGPAEIVRDETAPGWLSSVMGSQVVSEGGDSSPRNEELKEDVDVDAWTKAVESRQKTHNSGDTVPALNESAAAPVIALDELGRAFTTPEHLARAFTTPESCLVPPELDDPPQSLLRKSTYYVGPRHSDDLMIAAGKIDSDRRLRSTSMTPVQEYYAVEGNFRRRSRQGSRGGSLDMGGLLSGLDLGGALGLEPGDAASIHSVNELKALHERNELLQQRRERMLKVIPNTDTQPLVIITVGMPGCGKSYTAQRFARYTQWRGVPSHVYSSRNAGSPRAHTPAEDLNGARAAVKDLAQWLADKRSDVATAKFAVLDGGHHTKESRQETLRVLAETAGISKDRVIFYEMRSSDVLLEAKNTAVKLMVDYEGMDTGAALQHLGTRRRQWESVFEPLTPEEDPNIAFIISTNAGSRVQIRNVRGALPLSIVHFSMFLRTVAPPIFIAMCGETPDSLREVYGGNAALTKRGRDYAQRLFENFNRTRDDLLDPALGYGKLNVWCSTAQRSHQTAEPFQGHDWCKVSRWAALDDINHGEWDGIAKKDIVGQSRWARDLEERKRDRYFNPYPKGESLHSLMLRLEPVILELENTDQPLLIICHRELSWCLLAYLTNQLPHECAYADVGKHHLMRIDLNRPGKPVESVAV
eukprot:Hpha_TRINITY_DN4301_c0_g1::TRINITY_DN4301_c0_g1_i1::g.50076::m.50076